MSFLPLASGKSWDMLRAFGQPVGVAERTEGGMNLPGGNEVHNAP